MNGIYATSLGIVAYVVVGAITAHDVYAQGAPITRQMQDTQRAAQKKARESHKASQPQANKDDQKAPAPAPASAAQ